MRIRTITSLTLLLSFLTLILTSLVLYVVPEGRVAYWSDWNWLGLSKTQWGDIHTNSGFLFLAAGLVHLLYNWKPMMNALTNRMRHQQTRLPTPALLVALLLNLAVIAGTLLHLPPFSTILAFGHGFKEAAANKYGEPPYGHAERSSLRLFAQRTGLDLEALKAGLAKAGIRFTGEDQTILAIARANAQSPKEVYVAMQTGAPPSMSAPQSLPGRPAPGMGQMPLNELCRQYGLEEQRVLAVLATNGITASPQQSLKEIADAHGTDPHSLYDLLHAAFNHQ